MTGCCSKSIESFRCVHDAMKHHMAGGEVISADDGETVMSSHEIVEWFDDGEVAECDDHWHIPLQG